MREIGIDTRALEHPEPLVQATKILQELAPDSYLYMLHRKNPIPLLDLASEQGFGVLSKEDTQGDWHILIAKDPHTDLKALLRV